MDLHDLTREHGNDAVSETIGASKRCLVDLRRGRSPLTVDDLYELLCGFEDFDLHATVVRIGRLRDHKGISRKHRG